MQLGISCTRDAALGPQTKAHPVPTKHLVHVHNRVAARVTPPRYSTRVRAASADTSVDAPSESDAVLQYGVSAVQGPRELMEDCANVVPNGKCGYLYAFVFDGHSGYAAANWLNSNMYQVICNVVNEDMLGSADESAILDVDVAACPVNLHEHLAESFLAADKVLLQHLDELSDIESRSSGSTATVGMIRKDHLIVANVGDSRAVLCRKGKAVELTAEHRVYGRSGAVKTEIARIEAGGGWVRDGRVCDILGVSRTFGDRDFKGEGLQRLLQHGVKEGFWDESFAQQRTFTADPVIVDPDVVQMTLGPDDEFLIIATDGLWDVFSSEDAVALTRRELLKGTSPQDMADKLTQFSLKRYTADNVAAVVVDLGIGAKAKQAGKRGGGGGGGNGLFGGLFGQ